MACVTSCLAIYFTQRCAFLRFFAKSFGLCEGRFIRRQTCFLSSETKSFDRVVL